MIETLLPDVVCAEQTYQDENESELWPSERAALANAQPRRRAEFTTVRACARRALVRLGCPPAAIPRGVRGAPIWPEGVTGSMTHCAGYRAAAVAYRVDLAGLGIDAEPHDQLPPGVASMITRPDEAVALDDLAAGAPEIHWDRVLFSAKESVYKAQFPLTERWLDFTDVNIHLDAAAGGFQAHATGLAGDVVGRFAVVRGLVLTTVILPA